MMEGPTCYLMAQVSRCVVVRRERQRSGMVHVLWRKAELNTWW